MVPSPSEPENGLGVIGEKNIDIKALFNAWYYIALKGQQHMATALGMNAEADAILQEMKALKKAFNAAFWNGKALPSS